MGLVSGKSLLLIRKLGQPMMIGKILFNNYIYHNITSMLLVLGHYFSICYSGVDSGVAGKKS